MPEISTTPISSNPASWYALQIFKQGTAKGLSPDLFIDMIYGVIKEGVWKEQANTLEEYLTSPYPEGAGIPKNVLTHALTAPFTHQLKEKIDEFNRKRTEVIEALTPGDSRSSRPHDENGTFEGYHSPQVAENGREERKDRSRAISRSPRIIRELYHSDLIGLNEAVKLGPRVNNRKPTDQQLEARARADQVAIELERWVEGNPAPVNEADKPGYKRKVNKFVKEKLGMPRLVSVSWAEDAQPEAIAGKLMEKFDRDTLAQVITYLSEAL